MLSREERQMIAADYMRVGNNAIALSVLKDGGEPIKGQPYEYVALYVDALIQTSQFTEAKELNDWLLGMQPHDPAAVNRDAILLVRLDHPELAIDALQAALRRDPTNLTLKTTLAAAMQNLGQHEEAIEVYGEILRQDPTMLHHRMYLGMAQMTLGDFKNGIPNYGARVAFANSCPANGTSLWCGQSLEGKSIAVYAEQGIGDNLMMWRYLVNGWLRKSHGAKKVYYVCSPVLAEFFETQRPYFKDPDLEILVASMETIPIVDYQCPILGLIAPALLSEKQEFARRPYIMPPRAEYSWPDYEPDNAQLRMRYKIGLCVQGSKAHPNDQWRSIRPATAEKLVRDLVKDYYVYVISKDPIDPLLAAYGCKYLEAPDLIAMSVAAAEMDHIVTVDTALAHMAGAMGKMVSIMIPINPDWRWGKDGGLTPWYPHTNLIRQRKFGDWSEVFDRLSTGLKFFA